MTSTKRTEQAVALEVDDADPVMMMVIEEACRAGLYRRASRLNPRTARAWDGFGDLHSERVVTLLDEMLNRSGAGGAGPCSRSGE
jgi:hypothetical protein